MQITTGIGDKRIGSGKITILFVIKEKYVMHGTQIVVELVDATYFFEKIEYILYM